MFWACQESKIRYGNRAHCVSFVRIKEPRNAFGIAQVPWTSKPNPDNYLKRKLTLKFSLNFNGNGN